MLTNCSLATLHPVRVCLCASVCVVGNKERWWLLQTQSSLSLIACGGSQSQYAGQWPMHPAGSFPHNYSTCSWPMHKSVIIKIIRTGWAKRREGRMVEQMQKETYESILQTRGRDALEQQKGTVNVQSSRFSHTHNHMQTIQTHIHAHAQSMHFTLTANILSELFEKVLEA